MLLNLLKESKVSRVVSLPLLLNDSDAESHDSRRGTAGPSRFRAADHGVHLRYFASQPRLFFSSFTLLLQFGFEEEERNRKIGRANCCMPSVVVLFDAQPPHDHLFVCQIKSTKSASLPKGRLRALARARLATPPLPGCGEELLPVS